MKTLSLAIVLLLASVGLGADEYVYRARVDFSQRTVRVGLYNGGDEEPYETIPAGHILGMYRFGKRGVGDRFVWENWNIYYITALGKRVELEVDEMTFVYEGGFEVTEQPNGRLLQRVP